ncbi:MAG TPA: hypothetical protein VMW75_17035 [Thermoanaerobaculia bacterium]|nr:hypothetical protein [Thermoanaerobaculia bacterium]
MTDQTNVYEPIEPEQWLPDSQELPARPRRRPLGPVPLALLGVLLIACGFIGGVLVEKEQSSAGSDPTASGLSSRLAGLRSTLAGGGASGGGFAARFGSGGGATIGQVAYVHGDILYVTDAQGNTVQVRASEASTVTKTVKADIKQIHPGETVTVAGMRSSSGAILARSISVGSGAAGLGALLGGAPAGSSRTGSAGPSLFGG